MEQQLLPPTPRTRQGLSRVASSEGPTPPVTPRGSQLTANNLTRMIALLTLTTVLILTIPLARVAWNRVSTKSSDTVTYTFTEVPAVATPQAVSTEAGVESGLSDPEVTAGQEMQEEQAKTTTRAESKEQETTVIRTSEQSGLGDQDDENSSKETNDVESNKDNGDGEESAGESEGTADEGKPSTEGTAEEAFSKEANAEESDGEKRDGDAMEGDKESKAEEGDNNDSQSDGTVNDRDSESSSGRNSAEASTSVASEAGSDNDEQSTDQDAPGDSHADGRQNSPGRQQGEGAASLMDEAQAAGLALPSNPDLCSSRPEDIAEYTHPKLVGDHGGWLSYRGSTLDYEDCRLFLSAATTASPFNSSFRHALSRSPNELPSLSSPPVPKMAFLFLSRGAIPFHELWARFFHGHEGYYSIHIHSAPGFQQGPEVWQGMQGRQVKSKPVFWGSVSIVEAMKRLLATALLDPLNARFIILSEADIPLRPFPHIYRYIMASNRSFAGGYRKFFRDHHAAAGIFPEHLLKEGWVFGDAWMEMARPHAQVLVWEWDMYEKTLRYCKAQHSPACCVDENMLQTVLTERFPQQIHNRSLMFTYWQKPTDAHPSRFWRYDVTPEVLASMRADTRLMKEGAFDRKYVTEETAQELVRRAKRNCTTDEGQPIHCALFARKFDKTAAFRLVTFAKPVLGF